MKRNRTSNAKHSHFCMYTLWTAVHSTAKGRLDGLSYEWEQWNSVRMIGFWFDCGSNRYVRRIKHTDVKSYRLRCERLHINRQAFVAIYYIADRTHAVIIQLWWLMTNRTQWATAYKQLIVFRLHSRSHSKTEESTNLYAKHTMATYTRKRCDRSFVWMRNINSNRLRMNVYC